MNFFSIMNFFERCQKYMRAGDGKLTCDFPPPNPKINLNVTSGKNGNNCRIGKPFSHQETTVCLVAPSGNNFEKKS